MKLPEKFARMQRRTVLKHRFADWNLKIAAAYRAHRREGRVAALRDLLSEGAELLDDMIEEDQREMLVGRPTEAEQTYAHEFRVCLRQLAHDLRAEGARCGEEDEEAAEALTQARQALERLDQYLAP